MKITDVIRDRPGGLPMANVAVSVKRKRDGLTLATPVTDANGEFTYEVDGSPGAIVYEAVVAAGSNKKHSSVSVGPAGVLQLAEVDRVLRSFSDGVVEGVDSALAVVPATGLNVTVGIGTALVRGRIHTQYATNQVTIPTPDVTNPRIDLIVLRATVSGVDNGMTELVRLVGTPAAVPVAPTVTQNTSIWEIPLGQVRANPGASTIVAGDITDVRPYTGTRIRPGTITRAMHKGVGPYRNYDPTLIYAPDGYYGSGSAQSFATTQTFFTPHTARNAATLNRLILDTIAPIAGSTVRVAVYSSDGAGGKPFTRLWDAGTANTATAGVKLISGGSVPLTEETLYWLGFAVSVATTTFTSMASTTAVIPLQGSDVSYPTEAISGQYAILSGVASGGFPATLTGITVAPTIVCPFVWMGVA